MDAEVAGGKFPRLTKLIKMASYVRLFRLLRLSRIITRLEEALEIKHSVIDIAKFALFMVVVAHGSPACSSPSPRTRTCRWECVI